MGCKQTNKTYKRNGEIKMTNIQIGSKVKHKKHGFEGTIERVGTSYAKVRITKGSHPYNASSTYDADFSNLTVLDQMVVGAYVQHNSGFKGVVEEVHTSYVKVRITEGSHENVNSKGIYTAHESFLTVVESPKEHFETLLKEYKAKVDKAQAQAEAKEAKAKSDVEQVYEMEVEMEGMTIRTDLATFKKFLLFVTSITK